MAFDEVPNMQPCKFASESVRNASPASSGPPHLPFPALTSSMLAPFPCFLPPLPPSSLRSPADVSGPPPALLPSQAMTRWLKV